MVEGLGYNIVELRTRFEEMRTQVESQLNEFMKEIDSFNYSYDCDLDCVVPQILYNDLRQLRAWRNRLTQIIRVAIRHQHSASSFLSKLADLHKAVVDENLVRHSQERINRGCAIQERVADAGLVALDLRKLVVDTTNFCEFTKIVLQMLNDKRFDLRDACQEVQAVQALMTLSASTAE